MERSELKLITSPADAGVAGRMARRSTPVMLGSAVLLAAVGATLLGADRARSPIESREVARQTIFRAIMPAGSKVPGNEEKIAERANSSPETTIRRWMSR